MWQPLLTPVFGSHYPSVEGHLAWLTHMTAALPPLAKVIAVKRRRLALKARTSAPLVSSSKAFAISCGAFERNWLSKCVAATVESPVGALSGRV
jgi:hypothetical protein